ncbi:uncharacterized protein LOC100502242 [Zea mays]|jgi:hypothetical protein|uniref:Uncharacterized protein n=1 Tax=Zea mays TaxID=4577 RepID=C4J9L2_MAIZE|nr:uncharacterized protein LOC100502242 [Zea mays]ACR37862.1 unknown [Zea mays]|eukprot:NP_001183648.1 uncharacterized protein LOC100502242 [Zea mays]
MSLLGSLPSAMATSTTFSCRCFSSGARPCVGHAPGCRVPASCALAPNPTRPPCSDRVLGSSSALSCAGVLYSIFFPSAPWYSLAAARALPCLLVVDAGRCPCRAPFSSPASRALRGRRSQPSTHRAPCRCAPSRLHSDRALAAGARRPRLSCTLLRSSRSPLSSPCVRSHVPLLAVLAVYVIAGLVSPTIVMLLFPAAP